MKDPNIIASLNELTVHVRTLLESIIEWDGS